MKCDAALQAEKCGRAFTGLSAVNTKQRTLINLICTNVFPIREARTNQPWRHQSDVPVLPKSVLLLVEVVMVMVGSGSVEKVAKIFPKIIQAVKKVMLSFPILLRRLFVKCVESFFFFLNKQKQNALWMSAVYPINLKVAWSCGLGLNFLKVCHRCRSKSSLWVAYLNIPRWLADGFEGGGFKLWPCSDLVRRDHSQVCSQSHCSS